MMLSMIVGEAKQVSKRGTLAHRDPFRHGIWDHHAYYHHKIWIRAFQADVEVVGNCSIAISAAFYPENHVDGCTIATQKLQWGAVAASDNMVRHCTSSTEEVEEPMVGRMYAGKLLEM
jgi:hypothetical protein